MSKEKKNLLKKLESLDRRIIHIIIIVLMAVSLINPIGLPIKIDELTKVYYNTINALPPGTNVLITLDSAPGAWSEMGPSIVTTFKQLLAKEDVRFIVFNVEQSFAQSTFDTLVQPNVEFIKEYGTDWVWIGYLPGHETALSTFAENFLYTEKDAYGNMLKELPLMDEIKSMEDIDLHIYLGASYVRENIRQLTNPYKKPMIMAAAAIAIGDVTPYHKEGTILTYLTGLPGGAQYENICNLPGFAARSQDAISMVFYFLVGLMILVNSSYLITKYRGGTI